MLVVVPVKVSWRSTARSSGTRATLEDVDALENYRKETRLPDNSYGRNDDQQNEHITFGTPANRGHPAEIAGFCANTAEACMIFEGRSIDEVLDEDLQALVDNHVSERQHLEFKVTIDHGDDDDRVETLRDIVSLCNGGGGFLIVGIRDDGRGRAQRFEPTLVGDVRRIAASVRSLALDHIRERIEGLEVQERTVGSNPLVVVRVPASTRTPHMVTYQARTDFWTRHQVGKREMTIGEIRDAFTNDFVGERLSGIIDILLGQQREALRTGTVERTLERARGGTLPAIGLLEDGKSVVEALRALRDETTPFLQLIAVPRQTSPSLVPVDDMELRRVLLHPPDARRSGWDMAIRAPLERFGEGLEVALPEGRRLTLRSNGSLDYYTPIDELFCYRQAVEEFAQRPRLYPYPVVETPVSFLRLYRALYDFLGLTEETIFSARYRNIHGIALPPYHPRSVGFMVGGNERRYEHQHFEMEERLAQDFKPDKTALVLLRAFYAAFGFDPDVIPFYVEADGAFRFQ